MSSFNHRRHSWSTTPALRRLTELFIRKTKSRDAAYLVWDTHQGGLALRVQPTAAKSWVVIYRRQGRPRWLHVGAADAIGLAEARRLAARTMLAVAEGKDPAAEKKAEKQPFARGGKKHANHADHASRCLCWSDPRLS
jgi:hypothetical protein